MESKSDNEGASLQRQPCDGGRLAWWLLAGLLAGLGAMGSFAPQGMAATNEPAASAVTAGPTTLALTNDLISLEAVSARLAALSNRTDLAIAARTNALGLYLEAQQRLLETARQLEETQRFDREGTNAPALAAELQAQLAAPLPGPTLTIASNAPLAEVEQVLAQKEAELALATKDRDTLDQEPPRRAARTAELATLITTARAARERVQQELSSPPPPELDVEVRQATRDLQQARLQYREAELARYEEEAAYLNSTADLARLRLDAARRRIVILTQDRDLILSTLNRRRGQETLQAAARAEQARRRADLLNDPAISRLALTNAVLARERAALADRLRTITTRLDAVSTNLVTQRTLFQGIKARVDAAAKAGLSRNFGIGILLRRQRAYLGSMGNYREEARREQAAVSAVQIAQFAAVDARRSIEPIETTVESLLASLAADTESERRKLIADEASGLLGEQRDLLAALARDYDAQINLLLRLHTALGESAVLVAQFQRYLDQRVLWIRSLGLLTGTALRQEATAIGKVLTSPGWRPALAGLFQELRGSAGSSVAIALGVLLLLGFQPHLRRWLLEQSAVARQGRNTHIEPTLRAIGYTFLMALPVPLMLGLLAWRSVGAASAQSLALLGHLGRATLMMAVVVFVWEYLRQVFRPEGLAVAHFRLPEEDAALLRRTLSRYLCVIPVLGAANELFEGEPVEGVSNRLTFLVTTVVFAWLAHSLLRPVGGLGSVTLGEAKDTGRLRLWRRLVHGFAVILPLLLASVSALGYNYSARQLWLRCLASLVVMLTLQLLGALLLRWLYLVRRRLAMAHAVKLRSEEEAASGAPAEGLPGTGDETQSELLTWLEQARRLLRWTTGLAFAGCLWGIWSGVLPALQALDSVPLWALDSASARAPASDRGGNDGNAVISALSGGGSSPASGSATEPDELAPRRYVSAWDLAMVLLIVVITFMASQNLPGFLEMAVFSHLRLDRGSGYAITATLRYLIVLVGVILAARGLGLSWSKVQWLAAAVTVGIGFGLQEIFANFVSGLILLFERPLRVGDIVTVGDTSGVVARIQIRATTIRDWDNRELILPNKTLITGGFVNWTLSDSITRIACNVGIAYEANPRQARELLLAIARQHPAILTEPAPIVTFEGFGESTLNLSLRAHVSRTDQRASTTFDLHTTILDEFRQAGIEIAFPQRDLHIRSAPSGWSLNPPIATINSDSSQPPRRDPANG